jgi:hypothetical protein
MHAAGGNTDSHHIRTFFGACGLVDGAVGLLRFMSHRPEAAAAEEPDHNRRVVRFRQHHTIGIYNRQIKLFCAPDALQASY